jgi:hypothetical protein
MKGDRPQIIEHLFNAQFNFLLGDIAQSRRPSAPPHRRSVWKIYLIGVLHHQSDDLSAFLEWSCRVDVFTPIADDSLILFFKTHTTALERVDLPAPFLPTSETISPSTNIEANILQHRADHRP